MADHHSEVGSAKVHGTLPSQSLFPSRYVVLLVLWAVLGFMVYKVFTADKDYVEYDPFEILKIDPVCVTWP